MQHTLHSIRILTIYVDALKIKLTDAPASKEARFGQ